MSLVTTMVVFVASMVLGECRQVTSAAQVGNDSIPLQVTSEDVNSSIKTFFCPNETYNDMATLFFNPQESAILQLFHQDSESQGLGFGAGTNDCSPAPSVYPQTQLGLSLILSKNGAFDW